MKSKQIEEVIKGKDEIIRGLYKIFDKLEQRITTLEKVLESHAKCIGEMRDKKDEWIKILPRTRMSYAQNSRQNKRN